MLVAVLYRNIFSGKKELMFCAPEDAAEEAWDVVSKPRILTKKQFFNHYYPKIKHFEGMEELAKKLY